MLSCKQVAHLASDYLDNNTQLKWQMRMHLMMCANCRRFVKHLNLTRQLGAAVAQKTDAHTSVDVELIWNKVKKQAD